LGVEMEVAPIGDSGAVRLASRLSRWVTLLSALVAGGLVARRVRPRDESDQGGVQAPPVVDEEVAGLPPPPEVVEPPAPPEVVEPLPPSEVAGPPPPPPPGRRAPLLWPWLVLLMALVVGGLVAWWLLSRDEGDQRGGVKGPPAAASTAVVVPNVIGQPRLEAVTRLGRSGLVARVVRRPSGGAPPGSVFAESVARKTVVTLSVSALASVTVPAVVGRRAAVASAEMRARGLSVRYSGVLSDKARGTVLAQRPAAGARVVKGSAVALRVSRGSGAVPSVVGQTRSAAMATLEAAGFKAQAFTVPAGEKSGIVVAQSPQGGIPAPGGSKVRLYVSGGKAAAGPPPPPAP
jgi:PASTA domain